MAKQIPLTQGKVALVDDADYQFLSQFSWHWLEWGPMTHTGSAGRQESFLMARILTLAPSYIEVWHVDGDKCNCQRSNLVWKHVGGRPYQARPGHPKYRGVTYRGGIQAWQAQIRLRKSIRYLGYYSTPEQAAWAYDFYARHWKLNRKLNFSEDEFMRLRPNYLSELKGVSDDS